AVSLAGIKELALVVLSAGKKTALWGLRSSSPRHPVLLSVVAGKCSTLGGTMDIIIETAKLEDNMENQTNEATNTYTGPAEPVEEENKNGTGKAKPLPPGLRKGAKKYPDYIQIAMPTESRNKFPLEWWKTGIALVYALFNLVLTTVMITVVHERVPPKELSPPLPDKFFDYIDRVKWAFSVSEINGIILFGLWLTQWLLRQEDGLSSGV
uniref:Sphingomyelin synthase 2 n=1 Tax=Prolemur simus TaxID=1328070 RepID=A0A8C8Z5Z5_PROSS